MTFSAGLVGEDMIKVRIVVSYVGGVNGKFTDVKDI